MFFKAAKIKPEHVKVESDWIPFELQRNDGQSNLLYYQKGVRVKELTDEVRHIR